MEAREYCDSLTAELSAWKSKMDSAVDKFDRASSDDKKHVLKEINELHTISYELGRRIDEVKRGCEKEFSHAK